MKSGADPVAHGDSFCAAPNGALVLDRVQERFGGLGGSHLLVSGIPLPGRAIDPLLLRLTWGELRGERRLALKAADPLLQLAFRARRPLLWREDRAPLIDGTSVLLAHLGAPGARSVIVVPVWAFLPYQAVVVAGGENLEFDHDAEMEIDRFCTAAFRRLFKVGHIRPQRPGELSGRERKVVELSATGKTAGEIAAILQISQRTVHAHLQNASDKLRALNKTHTVVEALRYGQISL